MADAERISSLSDEVSSLKFKIREIEANNKEKDFVELKTKFVQQEAELTFAKQNLVNYIHSFNALEEKVKGRLEDQKARFDFNDEIYRLRLENQRLHEENASLMAQKVKSDEDLNNRLDETTKKLFVKTEECDEMQSKYRNILTTLNSERQEEIKSWTRRQDLIKRSIAELKH